MKIDVSSPDWFKSSRSANNGTCVEIRFDGDMVLVRDSKYLRDPRNNPATQPIVTVSVDEWTAFLAGRTITAFTVAAHPDGGVSIVGADGTSLDYTPAEWDAFTYGVLAGEFAVPAAV